MHREMNTSLGVVDAIHGIPVSDPYRWLEDRSLPDTESWITQQNDYFRGYIRSLGPIAGLTRRILEFSDVETVDAVGKVGERYFYRKRRPGEEQPSIYMLDPSSQRERRLVDPSSQGPYVSVSIQQISSDGTLLAYGVRHGGEDTQAIHFVEVDTGKSLPDQLGRGKSRGFAFSNSNEGFYYSHEFTASRAGQITDHEVRFHYFGSDPDDDPVLLSIPRSQSSRIGLRGDGDRLGVGYYHEHDGTPVVDYIAAWQNTASTWHHLCRNVPMPIYPFLSQTSLLALDYRNAPDGRFVELNQSTGTILRVVVPEWSAPLKQWIRLGNLLLIRYLVGSDAIIRVWSLTDGLVGDLPLHHGSSWHILPTYAKESNTAFLERESSYLPPVIYQYDLTTAHLTPWYQRRCPRSTVDITSHKMTYASKDGTEIEMSLVGSADAAVPKNRPLIMTAYGGFGTTLTPRFSVFVTIMLELGFSFAVPHIRGGGERGRSWHEAARRLNRQVAFDDFISAAQWLCENGFTSPEKLAIFGGSNSGTLVGAVITQRHDLFRAALCIAPLLDMIRYHLFDRARKWAEEYGTAEDQNDFRALLGYSPYHNVRENVDYPAILFVAGDQDTRCNAAHARKMAARLQERQSQTHAVLLDHSVNRGHTPVMPLSVRVEALTNRIAFLCNEIGVPLPKGEPS